MNEQEYKNGLLQIEREAKEKKSLIAGKYALAHNSVKVGDVVEDHIGKIRVESIKFSIGLNSGLPSCVYIGSVLNKDGSLSKREANRSVFQTNLKP